MTHYLGGLLIYGSAHDNSESLGTRNFNGKTLGSIDFSKLMKMFSLFNLASPEKPDFGGKGNLEKGLEKAYEYTSDEAKSENDEKEGTGYCRTCGREFYKGKLTHDKKQLDYIKAHKDTIDATQH